MRRKEFLKTVHGQQPDTQNVLLTGQATADMVGAAMNGANLYRWLGTPWGEDDPTMTVRDGLRAWRRGPASTPG